jgi:hypothetical protein
VAEQELLDGVAADGLVAAVTDPATAEHAIARGDRWGWFCLYERPDRAFLLGGESGPVRGLHQFLALYQSTRVAPEQLDAGGFSEPARVFRRHRDMNLLARFATVGASQIGELARTGQRIPAGVGRVLLVGGRALNVGIPLDLLRASASDRERTAWLLEFARIRPAVYEGPCDVDEGNPVPRRYAERVVVYDEKDMHVSPC